MVVVELLSVVLVLLPSAGAVVEVVVASVAAASVASYLRTEWPALYRA